MRIKLLHCGDLHLDAPFTSLSGADGRPQQRRQELKQALAGIVALAAEEQVDLLLVCGDLYEHGYTKKGTIQYICDCFCKIPQVSVLLIPGNHDPATPDSFYQNAVWPSNVHILADDNLLYEHAGSGTQVHGDLPLTGKLDRERIQVLMYHGTLDMPFSTDAFQPVSSMELEEYGFDYCAMGHFHSRTEGAGLKKRIYNPGSPEPLGFDEEGSHGVFIVTIDKEPGEESRISVEFRKIGKRRFINLEVQADGCLNDEQAAERATAAIEAEGTGDDLFRIVLRGYLPSGCRLDPECIRDLLKNKAFYTRVLDQTTPDYDFDRIAKEPGLRGLFVKKLLERAEKARGTEEREIVMQALYYGLEAMDEGSVWL